MQQLYNVIRDENQTKQQNCWFEPGWKFDIVFFLGSDDKTAKLWEVVTGRCMKTLTFTDKVKCVAWCPNSSLSLAAIAT